MTVQCIRYSCHNAAIVRMVVQRASQNDRPAITIGRFPYCDEHKDTLLTGSEWNTSDSYSVTEERITDERTTCT